jgi:transposase
VIQARERGLESCATNSPTRNGRPSNRCCRTNRGVPRVNDRRVLNGIFWVLRSGAPWRDLPDDFGPYTTCYNRFIRWRRAGVWGRIMNALTSAHDASVQMIDTSIVRVHPHGACIIRNRRQSMGRSRGGLTCRGRYQRPASSATRGLGPGSRSRACRRVSADLGSRECRQALGKMPASAQEAVVVPRGWVSVCGSVYCCARGSRIAYPQ